MRRIAIINQKGGVGKTTTSTNLGAALAEQGRRVVIIDMDPQANASLHLGIEAGPEEPSVYSLLAGELEFPAVMQPTRTPRLSVVASNIDLSGAEMELASAIGRDSLIRDAIESWCTKHRAEHGEDPADYVIFDCPPSLGLLSINALAAAGEVLITVQTQFLALMGMSKLVEVVQLIRRRLNPELTITGIVPCLYDSRLKLNREVLAEVRKYFPGQVFQSCIRSNVKLAEAPSYGVSILDYASDSNGAQDYRSLALEVIAQEERDSSLAHLAAPRTIKELIRERAAQQAAAREAEFRARDAASKTAAKASKATTDKAIAKPKAAPSAKKQDAPNEAAPAVQAVASDEAPQAANTGNGAQTVGEAATTQVTEQAVENDADKSSREESLREHVMQPTPPAAAAPEKANAKPEAPEQAESQATPRRGAVEDELRILRAEDLPQLPPEAFEVQQ